MKDRLLGREEWAVVAEAWSFLLNCHCKNPLCGSESLVLTLQSIGQAFCVCLAMADLVSKVDSVKGLSFLLTFCFQ